MGGGVNGSLECSVFLGLLQATTYLAMSPLLLLLLLLFVAVAPAGLPSEHDLLQAYCTAAGRQLPDPQSWGFYLALSLFRLLAILAGVQVRREALRTLHCIGWPPLRTAQPFYSLASMSSPLTLSAVTQLYLRCVSIRLLAPTVAGSSR